MSMHGGFSKRTFRYLISTGLICVFFYIYLIPKHLYSLEQVATATTDQATDADTNTKIVLYWTKYFEWQDFGAGTGRVPFLKGRCEVANCVTTSDRSLLNKSAAVLFHARDLIPSDLPPPKWRQPHQLFIFFNYESPVHTDLAKLRRHFGNYFNWTMTYRKNSDVVSQQPYGRLKCIEPELCGTDNSSTTVNQPQNRNKTDGTIEWNLKNKSRPVAWFVSNCRTESKRELLALRLMQHIKVDVYGNCPGAKKCSRTNEAECDRMLGRHYRFYLSFENSICTDYVTEKLYRAMANDVVPVVFGGAEYSQILPAGSFIDARDFNEPRELADHLNRLMTDDEEYMSYFRWKGSYNVESEPMDGWCRLCLLLHGNNLDRPPSKTYSDIAEWWAGSGNGTHCHPPPKNLIAQDGSSPPPISNGPSYVYRLISGLQDMFAASVQRRVL